MPDGTRGVLVVTTAPDGAVAERLVRALVEERHAACGNILTGMTSIYRWQGEVEQQDEVFVVLKTTAGKAEAVMQRIVELHPYEVPEAIVLPIDAGLPAYLDWIRESVEAGDEEIDGIMRSRKKVREPAETRAGAGADARPAAADPVVAVEETVAVDDDVPENVPQHVPENESRADAAPIADGSAADGAAGHPSAESTGLPEGESDDPKVRFTQLRQYVLDHPGDVNARIRLGRLHEERNEPLLALEQYEAASLAEPENSAAALQYAQALTDLNRFDVAERELRRALKAEPDNGSLHLQLGTISFRRGQYSQAEQELKRAIELLPQAAYAYFHRGESLNQLSRLDEALEMLERGIALDATYSRAFYIMGILYDRKGRPQESSGDVPEGARGRRYVISIRIADLAEVRAAGIVRPVSAEWQSVAPAMRRLEVAAGPSLDEQCRRLGDLPVGSAAITPAGDLQVPFMVHAVVRSYEEQVSSSGVRRALQNALRRVDEWGLDTIAVAPFGTGAGNLDADEAARIMIEVLLEHMQSARNPGTVEIIVDSEYERDVFERQLRAQSLPLLSEPFTDPDDTTS